MQNEVTASRSAFRTALGASAASICFGASVVATRFAVAQTTPVTLALLRYVIATLCLAPLLRRMRTATIPRRDLGAIAILGALFFGVFPWSFSAALTHSPSSRVAIIIATTPLLTLIVSRLRGYDRITPPKLAGQILAFVGLWIALRPAGTSMNTNSDVWLGDLFTFITALCGAIYNVFSRPYLKKYPAMQVTFLSMIAGVLFLAPIAGMHGAFSSVPAFTPAGWLAVVFLGALGGALGFSLWIWALERSTPSRVAVYIGLNPLTAITLGALLLHEPVTVRLGLGFLFVVGGILLANWPGGESSVVTAPDSRAV